MVVGHSMCVSGSKWAVPSVWWWVLAPGILGVVRGVEKLFGRDRRQVEMADYEKQAKERVAQSFKVPGRR